MTLRTFIVHREAVPHNEMLAWLKRRILQATPDTPVHATYTLMLQALTKIAHKHDLSEFPADKVLRLFDKARDATGWTRKRPPTPQEVLPEHHKRCATCAEIKPNKEFNRIATEAERRRYGWEGGKRRMVVDNYCQKCRHKRASAIRQEQRRNVVSILQKPHQSVLRRGGIPFYASIRLRLRTNIKYGKTRPVDEQVHPVLKQFYLERLRCLQLALSELERHVDYGIPLPDLADVDWTALLPEQDRATLLEKHRQLVEQHLPGRTPSI